MKRVPLSRGVQRGMALVTSLLLLVIITLLGMGMFKSFGTQEKIAGNMREKDRALHAAESAQQYAEWWLTTPNATAVVPAVCPAGVLDARLGQGQICSNWLDRDLGLNVATVPWLLGGAPIGVKFQSLGMLTTGQTGSSVNDTMTYAGVPTFYIADMGPAADAQGEAYKIDAYGYGGTTGTVAVVESTYEVQQGVVNRGGP